MLITRITARGIRLQHEISVARGTSLRIQIYHTNIKRAESELISRFVMNLTYFNFCNTEYLKRFLIKTHNDRLDAAHNRSNRMRIGPWV